MAGEAEVKVGSQGQTEAHLSQGQGRQGAAPLPVIDNKGPVNTNGSGDGVVPKDDPAALAAAKAKADEATAAAKEDEEDDEPVVTEWAEWEDPSASAAVELLKEAGVTPNEADVIFKKAIESGDLRDINVKELEAKVGKTKALLIMNGVRDYHARVTETNTKTVTEVKQVFGGDAGWNTVKEWAQAKEKVDPAFKKELDDIRDDLNKGGRAAKAAAKDLLGMYNGAASTKGLGNKNIVKGDGTAKAAGEPLTRAAYNEALKKAHAEGATAVTFAQLDARRRAGMKAGI